DVVDPAEFEFRVGVVRLDHRVAPIDPRCDDPGQDPNLNLTSVSVLAQGGAQVSTAASTDGRRGQSGELPTHRGRQTQAAIDLAARTVIARKGVLATTIADIATEAGRS